MSFDQFCERHFYASDTCQHPTLHKNQIDWLCDEDGQCIMDYVYKLEEFDIAAQEIASRTDGRIKLVNQSANVNPDSNATNYRELYTEKTKRIIATRFERDIDHFGYVF